MFTIEDHRRLPLTYPICGRGHVWKQRGNRTGHCGQCHRTFEGITVFDAHQRITDEGVVCLEPATVMVHGHFLREEAGSWRGPKMDEDALARRKSAG